MECLRFRMLGHHVRVAPRARVLCFARALRLLRSACVPSEVDASVATSLYVDGGAGGADGSQTVSGLNLMKIFRLARLARLVRALRFRVFYELKLQLDGRFVAQKSQEMCCPIEVCRGSSWACSRDCA